MTSFKNLTLYRLPGDFLPTLTPCRLDSALAANPLIEPGPLEMSRTGFYPLVQLGGAYTQRIGDRVLFCLATSKRLLPSAAIAQALQTKLAEIQVTTGQTASPRKRRKLRDEVVLTMMPQAFVLATYTQCVIDLATGWVWVDTSSNAKADACITMLREALGSFPAIHIGNTPGVRTTLTSWLSAASSPRTPDLAIGTAAVLAEPVEQGSRIAAKHQEMFSDEIGEHLRSGKQCEQLALSLEGQLDFSIDAALVVRGIKFADETVASDVDDDILASVTLELADLARIVAVIEAEFEPEEPV